MNEQSPLLSPTRPSEDGHSKPASPLDTEPWEASFGKREETRSTGYLVLLTLSSLGLQIAWSVETSHFSPYLLSLGLSKSLLALVWIAGPLSGTLVQPYVGIKSDNCRLRWGRRRPFIVGGGIATAVCMLLFAWAQKIVGGVLSIFGVDPESNGSQTCTIIFAVSFVYILDFAINVSKYTSV
jgi:solute carrier family 45, member 1/2/4